MGDDVNKTNSTIRIVGVPPGEAPLWVREQWVGLELPLPRRSAPRAYYAYGVLSVPRSWLAQWWGIIRGRAERIPGYAVESSHAVDILAASNPDAAAWWRKHTPHLIGPRRYLLFHEHVCQRVDV
jgi:hypothetical protein